MPATFAEVFNSVVQVAAGDCEYSEFQVISMPQALIRGALSQCLAVIQHLYMSDQRCERCKMAAIVISNYIRRAHLHRQIVVDYL